MRRATWPLAAILMITACQQSDRGDAVREAYDNRAAAVDRTAAAQPSATARKIYEARADALREEGKDREKGLEGRTPSQGQGSATATTSGSAN